MISLSGTERTMTSIRSEVEHESLWQRLALASGVGFVVLAFIAASIAPMPPGADATGDERVRAFVDHRDALLVQVSVRGIAAVLQIVFIAGLVNLVRRVQGGFTTLSLLIFAGGIAHTLMLLIASAMSAAAATIAGDADVAPGVIRALQAASESALLLEATPGAMLVATASAAILKTRVAPRWVGWLGLALMPVYLVGAFAWEDSPLMALGFAALFGEMLWFFAASLTLLLRSRAGQRVSRSRVATAS